MIPFLAAYVTVVVMVLASAITIGNPCQFIIGYLRNVSLSHTWLVKFSRSLQLLLISPFPICIDGVVHHDAQEPFYLRLESCFCQSGPHHLP